MRQEVCTFLSGIADDWVEQVKQIIDQNSRKRTAPVPGLTSVEMGGVANAFLNQNVSKVEIAGATVFALNVQEFVKL